MDTVTVHFWSNRHEAYFATSESLGSDYWTDDELHEAEVGGDEVIWECAAVLPD